MRNSRLVKPAALVAMLTIGSLGCARQDREPAPAPAPVEAAAPEPMTARATFVPRADTNVSGMVMFSQEGDEVEIVAHIEGAPPGTHGLHIHEFGDCSSEDFTSAGGHFNPTGAPHGGPEDTERHAGDLGNVEVGEDGTVHMEMTSDMITLGEGASSIIGRGVILHEKADDLVSQPTGAAGSRLACAVVEKS